MSKIRTFLLNTLFGGLIVVLPLAILFWIIKTLIGFIIDIIDPIAHALPIEWNENILRLIAFIVVLFILFVLGLVVRTQVGNQLYDYIESQWLSRIPFYKTIKETIIQFTAKDKQPFTQVVLVDVFGTPTRMTGFITDQLNSGKYTVFVPTGPNPTNGFVFHVSEEQLEFLDVSVDEALRSIIGVGVGSSEVVDKKKEEL